jgi:hypothetical protein
MIIAVWMRAAAPGCRAIASTAESRREGHRKSRDQDREGAEPAARIRRAGRLAERQTGTRQNCHCRQNQ